MPVKAGSFHKWKFYFYKLSECSLEVSSALHPKVNESPLQLRNLSHSPVSPLHHFPANTSLVSMQLLDLHRVRDECGSHQWSAPGLWLLGQPCPPHFALRGCGLGVLPGLLGSRYHCQEPVNVSSAPAPVSAAPGISKHSCKQVTS